MSKLTNEYSRDGLVAPLLYTAPPFHPFEPDTGGLVDGACAELALALPFGWNDNQGNRPEGLYFNGSNGWRHYDPKSQVTEYFSLALHMFAAAMEIHDNNGTPIFLGSPGSYQVRQSQLAFIRRIEGRTRQGDEHLLKVLKLSSCVAAIDQQRSFALTLEVVGGK